MTLRRVAFEGVDFEVDPSRAHQPAHFVLGVRKSGSSMFNRAAKLMAKFNAVNWVDVPGDLFLANVPVPRWREHPAPPGLLAGGNCYGGFRDFPTGLAASDVFRAARKVLLVRDPRDALVSEYFSTAYTHSIPETTGTDGAREDMLRRRAEAQRASIDAFAHSEAGKLAETIERYLPLLGDPQLLVLRYEAVVFAKPAMIAAVTDHFGWTITDEQVARILHWIDTVPETEDPTRFIRKVTPGDHREKLSAATIATLDTIFARAMTAFGYR